MIDFSTAILDNQPFSYTLVDMDDENPVRLVFYNYHFKTNFLNFRDSEGEDIAPNLKVHQQGLTQKWDIENPGIIEQVILDHQVRENFSKLQNLIIFRGLPD